MNIQETINKHSTRLVAVGIVVLIVFVGLAAFTIGGQVVVSAAGIGAAAGAAVGIKNPIPEEWRHNEGYVSLGNNEGYVSLGNNEGFSGGSNKGMWGTGKQRMIVGRTTMGEQSKDDFGIREGGRL